MNYEREDEIIIIATDEKIVVSSKIVIKIVTRYDEVPLFLLSFVHLCLPSKCVCNAKVPLCVFQRTAIGQQRVKNH